MTASARPQGLARWLSRGLLAAGLVLAGALKFLQPSHAALSERSWLDQLGAGWLLLGVGCLEIVLALLVLSRHYRAAAGVTFWMLAAYWVVLAVAVLLGEPVARCGCFGTWHAPLFAHFGILFSLLLLSFLQLREGA